MSDNRIPTQKFPPIRWRIFGFLFVFGLIAYLQQKSLTVTAEQMMPQLGLSQLQIGWLEQAFVLGYGFFQLPGGIFGQRYGARRTLVVIGLLAFAAMISTALAPDWASGESLFVVLLAAQLALGIGQAAIFPVSAGVFEAWFPPRHWAMVQGLQSMGLQLGAAMTPPLVASLMVAAGWQYALLVTTLPAIAFIGAWAWYGRNRPQEHPSVSRQELAEIGARDEEAGAGGFLASSLCGRFGLRWGYRLVPLVALPAGGILLLIGVNAANAYVAVLALALSYACVELTEGSFWGAAMAVGRGNTMAVGGVMNTGGNLGGIIGIPIVAYLSGHQMWTAAFLIGTGLAVLSAVAWLGIDTEEKANMMALSPAADTTGIAA